MQALPLIMSGARAIGGGMGRNAGGAPAAPPAVSPWDPVKDFPMPQKNPMFHDAPQSGPPPAKPPMGAGAQVVRDPTQGPAPRAMLASARSGPGSTHAKTSGPPSNRELGERAGYTTETVMGKSVPVGSSPGAAPIQASSQRAMPKTVSDHMRTAAPASAPPMPAKQPGMADGGLFGKMMAGGGTPEPNMPAPGQKPPMPGQASMWDRGVDMVTGGIGQLQDKLGESSTNPLFQTGMGLLASGYDGSNPYSNILTGLGGVQPAMMQQTMADYGIADKDREKKLAEALAAIGLKYQGGGETEKEPAKSRQAAGSAKVIRR
jgi:hypothetical protein